MRGAAIGWLLIIEAAGVLLVPAESAAEDSARTIETLSNPKRSLIRQSATEFIEL